MENKKGNSLLIAVIIVLLLIVGGLGSYIFFGIGNKEESSTSTVNNSQQQSVENNKVEEVKEEKGECPLTKFDSSYVLNDEDKEELLETVEGVSKENIDTNSFKITGVSETGYYIAVKFDTNPKTGDTFGFAARVNGKLKFISSIGSGTTNWHTMILDDALPRICS